MNLSKPQVATATATWNDYAAHWKRFETWTSMLTKPIGAAIIVALKLRGDEEVLDVATGSGEPGLSIARLLARGKVTAVDAAERMLEAAAANAEEQGVYNFEPVSGDACALPFGDGSFDAVSCRQGFMFFEDMQAAAGEMYRVLKANGRVAASVWASQKENPWTGIVIDALGREGICIDEEEDLFRCSGKEQLQALLGQAGFRQVRSTSVTGTLTLQSEGTYWRHFTSVVAPVARALAACDTDTQRRIRLDVYNRLQHYKAADGILELPFASVVVSGRK